MPYVVSSVSTLKGAREVNGTSMVFGMMDLGGKIAQLISAVAILNTTVSALGAAALSANASAVTFSALSGVTFTATLTPTNLPS